MTRRTLTVSELALSQKYSLVGGPFGSKLTTRDYVPAGVPVIRGANMPSDSRVVGGDFVFASEAKADELRSNLAYPGDLLFTQRGTLGQVGMLPFEGEHERFVVSQSQMKLTVDPDIADRRYLYYYFRTRQVVDRLIGSAITSGVPHINLDDSVYSEAG